MKKSAIFGADGEDVSVSNMLIAGDVNEKTILNVW